MSMVVTENGMMSIANYFLRGIPFSVEYGLYENDWHPSRTSLIGEVVPCSFSGYSGLLPIMSWSPPVVVGRHVVCASAMLSWTRGVGPVSGWVVGYYAVDALGVLLWGERGPGESALMSDAGMTYPLVPAFRVGSHYGG